MTGEALRDELVQLAHELGREARQFALLGEGNVSVACDDGTFWIKASGCNLGNLSPEELCRLRLQPLMTLLAAEPDENGVAAGLAAARVNVEADDTSPLRRPSIETLLHAVCLTEGGARWVGHTHPVSVNGVLCSRLGAAAFRRHLFPDAVVVCGVAPAVVPYTDPGLALARAVRLELLRYRDAYGRAPKLLFMESHGLVALGQSAREVLAINLMADKWAKTLLSSYALGGPRYLPDAEVRRLDARLDEAHRRRILVGDGFVDETPKGERRD